jgi:hypothetical protein
LYDGRTGTKRGRERDKTVSFDFAAVGITVAQQQQWIIFLFL